MKHILESLNEIFRKESQEKSYSISNLKKDLLQVIVQIEACEELNILRKSECITQLSTVDLCAKNRDERMKEVNRARKAIQKMVAMTEKDKAPEATQQNRVHHYPLLERQLEAELTEEFQKLKAEYEAKIEEHQAARQDALQEQIRRAEREAAEWKATDGQPLVYYPTEDEVAEKEARDRTELIGRVTQIREVYRRQIQQQLHRSRFTISLGLGLVVGAVAFQFALLTPVYAAVAGVGIALASVLTLNANVWASVRQGWSNFRFAITNMRGTLFARGQNAYDLRFTRLINHHVRPVYAQEIANDSALERLFHRFTRTQAPVFVDNIAQVNEYPTLLQKALWKQKKVNRLLNSEKPVAQIIDGLEASAGNIRRKYPAV